MTTDSVDFMDQINLAPGMGYYNRKGEPISPRQWGQMRAEDWDAASRVALTKFRDCEISTVCLGSDHAYTTGPPVIFETMIFWGNGSDDTWRYHTEGEASEHHAFLVRRLGQWWRRYRNHFVGGLDPR